MDWIKTSQFAGPEYSIGCLLWQVTHLWLRRLTAGLSEFDLTHMHFVLLAGIGWLTQNNDLLTQVQLAEFCQVDVMLISQVVRKLETKKLVKRLPHPTDTRAKVLALTPSGEDILKKALPLIESLDVEFFTHCDEVALLSELAKLYHARPILAGTKIKRKGV